MPTTADYLNNLLAQRDNLADNLVAKGVSASKTELLDTLVPKVLQIEESSGSNSLNIYTQMNEPEGKEGIWLKTSNKHNRVVVDSSTYLSGSKFYSSDGDYFPQHTGTLIGAAGGGYYHEASNSIYSFTKTTGSTGKINLQKYNLVEKTYTLVNSHTIGSTIDILGAVLVGDDLYFILKYKADSKAYHYLGKFNLISYAQTQVRLFTPYYATTYGYFLNSTRISTLVHYDDSLYFAGTPSVASTTEQTTSLIRVNILTNTFSVAKSFIGNHNTNNYITSTSTIARCCILGCVGKYLVYQSLYGIDNVTDDKINRKIRVIDMTTFTEINQTATGTTIDLDYFPSSFSGSKDFANCAISDNRLDCRVISNVDGSGAFYNSRFYLNATSTTGLLLETTIERCRVYATNTVDSTSVDWAYIANRNQLWGFINGSLTYVYSITSKQYSNGDLVLIRSDSRSGNYSTVLVSNTDEVIAKSSNVPLNFLRFCSGFDNAYLFTNTLLSPTAYYGNGTEWIKFRT